MTNSIRKKSSYLPHIDGLRAISVILVVLYHFMIGPFTGGYIGVDVFFTISGYLIIGSIVSLKSQNRFSPLDFWQRRIRRLIPAILATLIFCLLAGIIILNPEDLINLARQSLSALFSVINFTLLGEVDYFDQTSAKEPLLHFWSLAVEEQFYFVFPMLAILLFAGVKNKKSYKPIMISILILLSIASVLWAEYLMRSEQNLFAYYMMPTRFSQLALGGVLAILLQQSKPSALIDKIPRAVHSLLVTLGIAAIIYVSIRFTVQTPFPGFNSTLPTLGALAVLLSGGRSHLHFILDNKLTTYIGKLSFSLYLVHWPVWVLLSYYLNRTPTGVEVAAAVASSLAISMIIFHFVESPIRFSNAFKGNKMYRIIAPAFLGFTVFSAAIIATKGLPQRIPSDRRAFIDDSRNYHKINFGGRGYGKGVVNVLGHPNAKPDMLIIGDSKARQFAIGIDEELKKKRRKAFLINHDGCPFIDNVIRVVDGTKIDKCLTTTRIVIQYANEYSLPVLSLRSWAGSIDQLQTLSGRPLKFNKTTKQEKYGEMHFDFHAPLTSSVAGGRKIFIIGNNQGFSNAQPIIGCLSRPDWLGLKCLETNEFSAENYKIPAVEKRLISLTSENPNIQYIPMTDIFCEQGSCRQVATDGSILFSDSSHLSKIGSRRFAPKLLMLTGLDFEGDPSITPIRDIKDILKNLQTANAKKTANLLTELGQAASRTRERRSISRGLWNGNESIKKDRELGIIVAKYFADTFEEPSSIYITGFSYFSGIERDKNPELALKYMEHPSQASNRALKFRRATLYLDKSLAVYNRELGMQLLQEAADLDAKGAKQRLEAEMLKNQ